MNDYKSKNLDKDELARLTTVGKTFMTLSGAVMRNKKVHPNLPSHAPFMLFPTPFPEYLYTEATDVQKDFQILFRRASDDPEFIKDALKSVIVNDEFTRRLYEIYEKTRNDPNRRTIQFSLTRSDYMLIANNPSPSQPSSNAVERRYELRQIEMNTISCGSLALSPFVTHTHRYLADEMDETLYKKEQLPLIETYKIIGQALADVFQMYGNENAVILFIVEHDDTNKCDQKHAEYAFHEGIRKLGIKKRVPVLFRNLQEVHDHTKLTDDNKLIYDDREVAICYYRSGYSPQQYTNEDEGHVFPIASCGFQKMPVQFPICLIYFNADDCNIHTVKIQPKKGLGDIRVELATNEISWRWNARLFMDRSKSIQIPSVADQLIGTKKVQQIMALPGVVERFVTDPEAVNRIRRTFAGLYSLDAGKDGDEAVQKALLEPSGYVLKPQREGGGNNLYDDELVSELKRVVDKPLERCQYILMERIRPPVVGNYVVRPDSLEPIALDSASELGIHGYILSDGDKILKNEHAGHLFKTKDHKSGEGGIMVAGAGIDTPCLF